MPATYEPIATQTLGSAVGTVAFSSIPSTYTDLVLVITSTNTSATCNIWFQMGNGTIDSGSSYSWIKLNGNGSTASSTSSGGTTPVMVVGAVGNPSNPSVTISHFMNYSNTTTRKTVLSRSGSADVATSEFVGMWRNTSAINILNCVSDANNFAIGSTFTLYGIKAA
jgi:hypothetical protein